MKKIVLIVAFLFTNFLGFSQRFKEVVLWQVETRAEGIVFGISEKIKDAQAIIDDFQNRNEGSKYDVSDSNPVFKYTTFPVKTRNENPVDKFKHLAGKNYKVLSKDDLISIDIVKRKDLESGIKYYMSVRKTDWKFTSRRINHIVNNFNQYRIENPENNVVFSK